MQLFLTKKTRFAGLPVFQKQIFFSVAKRGDYMKEKQPLC